MTYHDHDADLCSDCPPVGYPTNATRCDSCPRFGPPKRDPELDAVLSEALAATQGDRSPKGGDGEAGSVEDESAGPATQDAPNSPNSTIPIVKPGEEGEI